MDLLVIGVIFTATYLIAHFLGSTYAGICAVLVGVIACSWRLAATDSRWRQLGLKAPQSWLRTIVWSIALLVTSELAVQFIVAPLAQFANWPPLDISRFARLHGNWHALVGWLVAAWTSAAVGEELIFRAFLLSRLQTLLGPSRGSTILAVLIQACCFGLAHFYLGPRGVMTAFVIGVLYGGVYVGTARNLPALILAHGLTDSLSLIALYAGAASS